MITFFIFYEDLKYATFLSNAISTFNSNTQLIGIDERISKCSIEHCNHNSPHIIIATENIHKELSKKLNFNYIAINISQNSSLVTQKICNQVNKVTHDFIYHEKVDSYNFRKNVYLELKKYNFNPTLCGTQFLVDCIMFFHEHPEHNLNNVNIKSLYLPIAHKYQITVKTVDWNIHSTISDMCKNTEIDFRLGLYGTEEISPHQVIALFSNLY